MNDTPKINEQLILYAIKSKDGKWLRSKGYKGRGNSWVDDIYDAKLYNNLSTARSQVTFWAKNYPEFGIPVLVELTVVSSKILDESKRVNTSIQKIKEKKIQQYIRNKEYLIKIEEEKIKNAKKNLDKLKKDTK